MFGRREIQRTQSEKHWREKIGRDFDETGEQEARTVKKNRTEGGKRDDFGGEDEKRGPKI